jgi:molybdopterin synthase sulfur carrier subunit
VATVWIPSLLRGLAGGQASVEVSGSTLGEVIAALEGEFPGIRERLCVDQEIHPAISAHIDGRIAALGLREPVQKESEILFLPAVAGG